MNGRIMHDTIEITKDYDRGCVRERDKPKQRKVFKEGRRQKQQGRWVSVLASQGCHNKYHGPGGLNSRHPFSHRSGG